MPCCRAMLHLARCASPCLAVPRTVCLAGPRGVCIAGPRSLHRSAPRGAMPTTLPPLPTHASDMAKVEEGLRRLLRDELSKLQAVVCGEMAELRAELRELHELRELRELRVGLQTQGPFQAMLVQT